MDAGAVFEEKVHVVVDVRLILLQVKGSNTVNTIVELCHNLKGSKHGVCRAEIVTTDVRGFEVVDLKVRVV